MESKDVGLSLSLNSSWRMFCPEGRGKVTKELLTRYYYHWKPASITTIDLAREIWKGNSFGPVFVDNKPSNGAFVSSRVIAVDLDCDDETAKHSVVASNSIVGNHSAFMYYTPSSSPPKYRTRIVFILEKEITDSKLYAVSTSAVYCKINGSDMQARNPGRCFFGSHKGDHTHLWNILTSSVLDRLIEEYDYYTEMKMKADIAAKKSVVLSSQNTSTEQERQAQRKYCNAVLVRTIDELDSEMQRGPGNRRYALLSAGRTLGEFLHYGFYSQNDIYQQLIEIANPLVAEDGQNSIITAINDSINYGIARPRFIQSRR